MNTPNKITLARILLIPVVVFFYLATFIPYGKLVAALVFVIACMTDFLDGYLARKNNQVTTLGKFFDSIADKVLIMAGMILVVAFPVAGSEAVVKPQWLGLVFIITMLAREFIISALRQLAAAKGIVLAADQGGRVKAAFQDVTIALYMFYAFFVTEIYVKHAPVEAGSGLATANAVIGIILMVMLGIAAVLTIWSGVSYIVRNTKVFKDEASEPAAKPAVIESSTEEAEKVEETESKGKKKNSKKTTKE